MARRDQAGTPGSNARDDTSVAVAVTAGEKDAQPVVDEAAEARPERSTCLMRGVAVQVGPVAFSSLWLPCTTRPRCSAARRSADRRPFA